MWAIVLLFYGFFSLSIAIPASSTSGTSTLATVSTTTLPTATASVTLEAARIVFPDISTVSSFYGPGAHLSWILVTLSCFIDLIYRSSSSSDGSPTTKRAHMLGIDLNLISCGAYPLVAACNVLWHSRGIISGSLDPVNDAPAISAALLVLRSFYVFGPILVAAMMWRRGRWIYWLLLLYMIIHAFSDHILRITQRSEGLFIRGWMARTSEYEMVFMYGMGFFGILLRMFETERSFSRRFTGWEGTAWIAGVWVFCVAVETFVDFCYGQHVWNLTILELPPNQALGLPSVYVIPAASANGLLVAGQEQNLLKQLYSGLQQLTAFRLYLAQKKKLPNRWKFVERSVGASSIIELAPETLDHVQFLLRTVFLCTIEIGLLIWFLMSWFVGRNLRLFGFRKRALIIPGMLCAMEAFWDDVMCHVTDFIVRVVTMVGRPNRLFPVTSAGWLDLDQMAALLLNGIAPVLFSVWSLFVRKWSRTPEESPEKNDAEVT